MINEYKGFRLFIDQDICYNRWNFTAMRKRPDSSPDIIKFTLDDYYIMNESYIIIQRFHEEVDKFLKNQISASDFK